MGIERVIDGVLKFQREVYPREAEWFRELAQGQSPDALFIGCSDSRVVPELLTQQRPGALFVVRIVGNIVPPYGAETAGVAASIEYAVAVLKVPDIIVCGHSGCGAMTAVQRGAEGVKDLPAAAQWLRYADTARDLVAKEYAGATPQAQVEALVRENVLAQLANLLTHPTVAKAVEEKKLRLHGWVYEMSEGRVDTYDAETAKFVPLAAGL